MRDVGVGARLFALSVLAACGGASSDGEASGSGEASSGGASTIAASDSGTSAVDTSEGGTSGADSSSGGGSSGGGSSGVGSSSGATATEGSTGSSGGMYSTDFPGTENPISEGGVWTNGGVVGLDWQDVATDQGLAFGSGFSAGYDDCLAHLSGFAPDHFAEATLHVAAGYTPPNSHEVELLLRFEITAHSARGYEINNGWDGAYSQIVRWNGPLDDFTYLDTTGPGFGALVEGDVIRAEAVGDTITAYKNGMQVLQATDATWSDGNPGMAFFIRPGTGAEPTSYCFTAYSAGDL